jgi:hypothetical protein
MGIEVNRKIVDKFFEAFNSKDRDQLALVLHDDFYDEIPRDHSKANFEVNPYFEFLKLLDFNQELITNMEDLKVGFGPSAKVEALNEEELTFPIMSEWEVNDVIIEKNRVWVTVVG